MTKFPSRFRRLDDALADLPVDDPMLLTELDGLLTGVIVCPDLIMPGEWLPLIWEGSDDGTPFEDAADVQFFVDMVMARYNEIVRDLGRDRPQPIFDVDQRNGEVLWEYWIEGFDLAMRLRPDSWAAIALGGDARAIDALAGMTLLIEVARDQTSLMSDEINALCDAAPGVIRQHVLALHRVRIARDGAVTAPGNAVSKAGRNDPCPCGSGKKYKRCCGLN
jgi:uncharacterized protein